MRIRSMTTTNYTACFSLPFYLTRKELTQHRIEHGHIVENIEYQQEDDGTTTTNFMITCGVDDNQDPDEYFDMVGRELSRYLMGQVCLDEIFVDD